MVIPTHSTPIPLPSAPTPHPFHQLCGHPPSTPPPAPLRARTPALHGPPEHWKRSFRGARGARGGDGGGCGSGAGGAGAGAVRGAVRGGERALPPLWGSAADALGRAVLLAQKLAAAHRSVHFALLCTRRHLLFRLLFWIFRLYSPPLASTLNYHILSRPITFPRVLPLPQARRQRRQALVREIAKDLLPTWGGRALAAELVGLPLLGCHHGQGGAGDAGAGAGAGADAAQAWLMAVRTLAKKCAGASSPTFVPTPPHLPPRIFSRLCVPDSRGNTIPFRSVRALSMHTFIRSLIHSARNDVSFLAGGPPSPPQRSAHSRTPLTPPDARRTAQRTAQRKAQRTARRPAQRTLRFFRRWRGSLRI